MSGMRVKTDITVYSGGCIRFGSHIVQSLGMCEGDGVELVRYGVELMLCVVRKPDTQKYGNLLVRSSRGGRSCTTRRWHRSYSGMINSESTGAENSWR